MSPILSSAVNLLLLSRRKCPSCGRTQRAPADKKLEAVSRARWSRSGTAGFMIPWPSMRLARLY
jgi:hypothetical protein